jgi:hypothetical protein
MVGADVSFNIVDVWNEDAIDEDNFGAYLLNEINSTTIHGIDNIEDFIEKQ